MVPMGLRYYSIIVIPSHVTVSCTASSPHKMVLSICCSRISSVRAKKAFLTTYYDPYYLDLYLYVVKPDTMQCAKPPSPWTSSTTDNSHTSSYLNVITSLWNFTLCMIVNWQRRVWEVWNANYPQQGTLAWPPT